MIPTLHDISHAGFRGSSSIGIPFNCREGLSFYLGHKMYFIYVDTVLLEMKHLAFIFILSQISLIFSSYGILLYIILLYYNTIQYIYIIDTIYNIYMQSRVPRTCSTKVI